MKHTTLTLCAGLALLVTGEVCAQDARAGFTAASFPVGMMEDAELMPVDSIVTGVTVYDAGAVVTRTVRLQNADGSFLIEGLPIGTDLASLRLRGQGCEVVSMETRRRTGRELDADELDELNAAVARAAADVRAARDAVEVARAVTTYHTNLQEHIQELVRADLASGDGDPAAWSARAAFIKEDLRKARLAELEAEEALVRAKEELALAEAELKNGGQTSRPDTYDVIVDLVDLPTKDIPRLELDYFVGQASWAPEYDLRASADLEGLELVYNAKVRQTTGEDWNDVPLVLSTAKPRRGASGPDPRMAWVDLYDPEAPARGVAADTAARFESEEQGEWFLGAGNVAPPAAKAWAPSFAAVDASGLAVRFELPRRESVPSSDAGQVFAVGRATTALAAEHIAVPAASNHVWMRGKGTNDTPWSLLPGNAKVFVGGDFVGDAWIGAVPVGEDFELPLGVDTRLTVERTRVADLSGERGFSDDNVKERAWRLVLSNHGGLSARADGAVRVIVQEALPISTDEDIRVRLGEVTPPLSKDERFAEAREERGILTWVLDVPAGGEREVRWGYEVRWPDESELIGL